MHKEGIKHWMLCGGRLSDPYTVAAWVRPCIPIRPLLGDDGRITRTIPRSRFRSVASPHKRCFIPGETNHRYDVCLFMKFLVKTNC